MSRSRTRGRSATPEVGTPCAGAGAGAAPGTDRPNWSCTRNRGRTAGAAPGTRRAGRRKLELHLGTGAGAGAALRGTRDATCRDRRVRAGLENDPALPCTRNRAASFGRGLVDTPGDFGRLGELHPEQGQELELHPEQPALGGKELEGAVCDRQGTQNRGRSWSNCATRNRGRSHGRAFAPGTAQLTTGRSSAGAGAGAAPKEQGQELELHPEQGCRSCCALSFRSRSGASWRPVLHRELGRLRLCRAG